MSKNISILKLQKPIDVSVLKAEAPFVCMIYSNQNATIDEISSVADWLISSGCRYIVCAGNDELVMTTWHEDETIEEVVWFWLNLTNFDDINFENYLALIIGESKEIEEEIQQTIKENSL
jgi:hypothetical protein